MLSALLLLSGGSLWSGKGGQAGVGGCNQPALLWDMQVRYPVLMGTLHCSAHAKETAPHIDWHDLQYSSISLIKRRNRELTHSHSKVMLKQSTNLVARSGKSDQGCSWPSYKEGPLAHLHVRSLLSASPNPLQLCSFCNLCRAHVGHIRL